MSRPDVPILDAAFVAEAAGDLLVAREGPDARFQRTVIDSRLVRPGDLFVALPGEHTDGHDYAAAAVAAGASGVLIARPVEGTETAARIVVRAPLAALQRAGAAWRAVLPGLEVVGVTGNVGKTTTKMIVAAVLASKYRTAVSEKNYNNEIGVPLCMLDVQPGVERAVIEMGMYTTGEIALLCEWAKPRIGVELNVGPVHLERAGSRENIARAKRELVEALPANGHAVLNADDAVVAAMAEHTAARVWRFSAVAEAPQFATADVRARDVTSEGERGFTFTIEARGDAAGNRRRVRVPLPGAHLVSNVLAAATVGLADGIAFDAVCDALEALAVPTRLKVRRLASGVTLLDDTYNANPASTEAALRLLAEMTPGPGGRRLALLGEMLELGPESDEAHDRIGQIAAETVDSVLTVGERAARIAASATAAGLGRAEHLGTKDRALEALRGELRGGDLLLVKGSHALALETVVAALEGDANAAAGTGGHRAEEGAA